MFDSKPQILQESATIRVLHVDDDSSFLDVTKQILTDIAPSIEVDCALSVDEAFSKLSNKKYDVLVSDYAMPMKNGLDFLRELKNKDSSIPFILFTGKGREEIAIQALNLGADGYFNKQGDPKTVYGELSHGIKTVYERRKTKLALEESERFCQKIMQQAREMIFIHDAKGRFVYVNPQASKNLGYTTDEFTQMHVVDIDGNATKDGSATLWPKVIAGQIFTFETIHKRKDGTLYPAEVSISAIKIDEQQLVMGFAKDITELKKAQAKLTESETRYRLLAENIKDVIWTMNLDGQFTYISPSVLQLRGFTAEEAVQQSLTQTLTPASAQVILETFQKFAQTGEIPSKYFELEATCKDRSTIWIEVSFSVLRDKDGRPQTIFGVSRDITERRNAQEKLRNSHRELEIVNEKLRVVGSLTRHDVGNKIMVAKSTLYLLKKDINNPTLTKYIDTIDEVFIQSSRLFEFSNLYEKIGAETPKNTNVADCFNEATKLMPHPGIQIINNTQGLTVFADSMLQQLFYNLIDNSLKHGKTTNKIQLSYTQNKNKTTIIYQDNGVGIPVEDKEKIFSKGYTTENGSGLGLKLVKKMVEAYEWSIEECGIYGQGAKFIITIPQQTKCH